MSVGGDLEDRAVGCLLGLAIGDALGTTLEFSARDSAVEVKDFVGGGPFHLQPGEWTDDTSMALCLADSLIACGGFDAHDLLDRFLAWYRSGLNSVTGSCFDIGLTTGRSLQEFERSGRLEAGPEDIRQSGNGSLMRLAPVAILFARDGASAAELAELQSRTTHPSPLAHDACRFYALLLTEALAGAPKERLLAPREWSGRAEVRSIAAGGWTGKNRREISSSGFVIDTLEAALWCVGRADDFAEAVLLAANLGGDSDTVAAVTGQLAGAHWSMSGIPERWSSGVAWSSDIADRARRLLAAGTFRA
jgi:ADP-ribosyl-[dinitrogen reductase] hydrolase